MKERRTQHKCTEMAGKKALNGKWSGFGQLVQVSLFKAQSFSLIAVVVIQVITLSKPTLNNFHFYFRKKIMSHTHIWRSFNSNPYYL